MAKRVPRAIVDLLGDFLRRNARAHSDGDLQKRMEKLCTGRVATPESTSPFVLSDVDSSHAPDGAIVAGDLAVHDVRERLVQLADYVAAQLRAGELPHVDLPDLHRANTVYDDRGNVFLGHAVRRLAFDRHGCKPFMRLLLALETAADNLRDGVSTTKRGLFYAHRAKLPDDASQIDSDRALTSLANVLRVRRRALGFVAARRGTVYGRLVIRHGGEVVDLSQVGAGGGEIPRSSGDFEIVSSDATAIVIIEKDAIAHRLAQERWWDDARCIMVCSTGSPSMAARELVRKLMDTLGIPAVVFADADPGGIQVALTFAHGSISTGLETPWLACNGLSWVGFRPSDIARLGRKSDLIRLSDEDREAARSLLALPSRTYLNDRVREELSILVDHGHKVEMDALMRDARLVEYIDRKLADGDVIKL